MGGFLAFALYIGIKHRLISKTGALLMFLGLVTHTTAFITRWFSTGHIPLSNMYEYLSLMGWTSVLIMLFLIIKYKQPLLGSLIAPVVFMLIVTAALLPKDANQSLMPALRSVWLNIHVSLAAFGSGCFLVSFAASAIFLIRRFTFNQIEYSKLRKNNLVLTAMLVGIPVIVALVFSFSGLKPPAPDSHIGPAGTGFNGGSVFILLGIGFIIGIGSSVVYWRKGSVYKPKGYGGWIFIVITLSFLLGGIIEGIMIKLDWIFLTQNLSSVTHDRTLKSAWLIFEFTGVAFCLSIPIAIMLFPLMRRLGGYLSSSTKINLESLDTVSYKSVSLGYPLYTIGALFAGAIWAEQAWGSFWSWDPKEVGALIVWLFYSGYLHARFNRGWQGTRAAVLVVAGFLVFILSFFGNYFFGGLHAYT